MLNLKTIYKIMIARIIFRSEVYVEGDNAEDIARKWEGMKLYSAEANKGMVSLSPAEFVELDKVEDENYNDITDEFKRK